MVDKLLLRQLARLLHEGVDLTIIFLESDAMVVRVCAEVALCR